MGYVPEKYEKLLLAGRRRWWLIIFFVYERISYEFLMLLQVVKFQPQRDQSAQAFSHSCWIGQKMQPSAKKITVMRGHQLTNLLQLSSEVLSHHSTLPASTSPKRIIASHDPEVWNSLKKLPCLSSLIWGAWEWAFCTFPRGIQTEMTSSNRNFST